jgi:alkylhydroperoxidase family enzyme
MPRFELPDDSYLAALPAALRDSAQPEALINVFRAMLRSPQILLPVIGLGSAQFAAGSLSPVDREVAILAAGSCFEAPYEAAQHEPISRSVGVTDSQRAALADRRWSDEAFSAAQQAMLAFVSAVAGAPIVSDPMYAAVREHFTEQQIVELVVLIGYYFLIARVSTVLELPLDPPADARVLDAGTRINRHGEPEGPPAH